VAFAARVPLTLAALLALVFVWSAVGVHDRFTWYLEAMPVIIAVPLLAVTYRRFALSGLAYLMVFLHAIVLLIGAHYTYAEVPLFDTLRDMLDLNRNHYDRVGHIAQGFFPAIIAREILLRLSPLRAGRWLFFLVLCVCLAISAFYELVEWWVAVFSGSDAVAFLATQGDPWDTQWDMFLALSGAIVSQLLLSSVHDRSLAKLATRAQ
jgi:putative membrane protein